MIAAGARERAGRLFFALVILGLAGCGPREAGERGEAAPGRAPSAEREVAFVPNASCAECHKKEYEAWLGSHHDLAMQVASEETVLGDFDDARFGRFPLLSRFFRRDGKFFVYTEGPDGRMADFEIRYAFGVDPLQQYLIEFPGGRLQSLTIAWDTQGKRWFDLYPDERISPDDPLHWTGRYQNWNYMCAECHSTHLEKRYDPKTDAYRTSWFEIDVSCQACHGPGRAHDEWARALPEGAEPPPGEPNGLQVNFRSGDPYYEVEVCAPCHSRRHPISVDDRAGRPFLDDFMPALLRDGLYHADGQILEEVYVWGSFVQSKMYQRGVRCSDCHDPHDLQLRAPGDALCLRCHQEQPDPRFSTLIPKNYDTPAHHFHLPESTGAPCVSCHMLAETYMGVDLRHDHSFRVPRPDLSAKLGTPDTCSACHADKPAQWSADAVAQWYGPERRREPHYGEVFAAARAEAAGAEIALAALAAEAEQPAIVRATALELLARYGPAGLEVLVAATRDAHALVRVSAVRGLEGLPPERRLPLLAPLLRDPIRAVRIEAARVLAELPAERFEPEQRRAFAASLAEYEAAQWALADTPGAHLNLAVLDTHRGDLARAEAAYLTALRMDPDFLPALANLATLYNTMGRNADAERVLRDALARFPDQGEFHYSLGLLLAEEQRLDEAVDFLAEAAERLPRRARVHYNHALALQHLGRRAEAETALQRALAIDPRDPDIAHAVAVFYVQQGQWERALPYAQQLVELVPGAPGPLQMLQRIEAALSAAADLGNPGRSGLSEP